MTVTFLIAAGFAAFLSVGLSAATAPAPPDREGPAIYLVDLFEENGLRFVHWKWGGGAPRWVRVEVVASDRTVLAMVERPNDRFDIDRLPSGVSLRLTPLTASGERGAEHRFEPSAPLPASVPWIDRIGVRQNRGKAVFFHRGTGREFHPRGYNYIPLRGGDHATFDADTSTTRAHYDPLDAESMFRAVSRAGGNVTRVFLAGRSRGNPGIAGEPGTEGLYLPYLDNIADFLHRGASHGVYTIFNFCDIDLPQNDYYRNRSGGTVRGNRVVLTKQGLAAQSEYVSTVIGYLKRRNPDLPAAVLAVQFSNEMHFDLSDWPFDQTGPVTTANGKTYDMSRPDQRAACAEEGWLHYYRTMNDVVKKADPDLLTCEGIFVANAVGRTYRDDTTFDPKASGDRRCPPSVSLLSRTPLDFLDIHLYPQGPVPQIPEEAGAALDSSLYDRAISDGLLARKPVILGEFGSFHARDPVFAAARARMRATRDAACESRGFTGFLAWTFDSFEQKGLYPAMTDGGAFVTELIRTSLWPIDQLPSRRPRRTGVVRNPMRLQPVTSNGAGKGFRISIIDAG